MMDKRGRVNTCGNTMHYTGITVCNGLGKRADAPELMQTKNVSAVSGACFAMPRSLWNELGGLDESFFTYLEDTDLSLRARLAGYRCVYVPEAVVYHNYANRFSATKLYYLERNRIFMLMKCYRTSTLIRMLPALLLAEAVTWGYAVKSGPTHIAAKARAYVWILTHRSAVRAARRKAQESRRATDTALLAAMTSSLHLSQLAGAGLSSMADRFLNPAFRLWRRVVS
jgi:GT2 family glycosyltransferase